MFNFFSILLLLIAVLQIAAALQLWVKPSNLQYTAEIICLNSDGPITIGQATHSRIFGEEGKAGYVDIDTDLSSCDQRNSTVKVRITEPYCFRSDSKEFVMSKAELSARKSAVVLEYKFAPSVRKHFYFQQSSLGVSQRPLVDYELEIECDYKDSRGETQYIMFGSGVQLNGQNGINILIYEKEKFEFCSQGRIALNIYNAGREKTQIDVTKEFLLENDAFNIDISAKTIQPIPQNGRGN